MVKTFEELQEQRNESLKLLGIAGDQDIVGMTFTCDNCTEADTCEYSFDAYNTRGDCLAEK